MRSEMPTTLAAAYCVSCALIEAAAIIAKAIHRKGFNVDGAANGALAAVEKTIEPSVKRL